MRGDGLLKDRLTDWLWVRAVRDRTAEILDGCLPNPSFDSWHWTLLQIRLYVITWPVISCSNFTFDMLKMYGFLHFTFQFYVVTPLCFKVCQEILPTSCSKYPLLVPQRRLQNVPTVSRLTWFVGWVEVLSNSGLYLCSHPAEGSHHCRLLHLWIGSQLIYV